MSTNLVVVLLIYTSGSSHTNTTIQKLLVAPAHYPVYHPVSAPGHFYIYTYIPFLQLAQERSQEAIQYSIWLLSQLITFLVNLHRKIELSRWLYHGYRDLEPWNENWSWSLEHVFSFFVKTSYINVYCRTINKQPYSALTGIICLIRLPQVEKIYTFN